MSGDHSREHGRSDASRLGLALALSGSYLVAEAVGGWYTNSLALLADAGHMLSDVAALAIAMAALHAASRPATERHTWGYHRAEVLAALLNAVSLCVVAAFIGWEAFERFSSPPEVRAPVAFLVATGGLAVNIGGLFVLGGREGHGLGVRSAWLHMAGDALGSIGAMTSSAAIAMGGWRWPDPLASLLIAVLIVRSASALLLETIGVLMERCPAHIPLADVQSSLKGLGGVVDVHDLHVWTITTGREALSGHLVVREGCDRRALLRSAGEILAERFGIAHITIQLEDEGYEHHEP